MRVSALKTTCLSLSSAELKLPLTLSPSPSSGRGEKQLDANFLWFGSPSPKIGKEVRE